MADPQLPNPVSVQDSTGPPGGPRGAADPAEPAGPKSPGSELTASGPTGSGPTASEAAGPREPQWRVASSAIGLWTVQEIIGALFLLIPAMAASLFVPDAAPGWLVVATDILPWALAAFFLGAVVVLPRYKYAVHRWEVTPDGIYTLTGWLSRTWILVPISRIQTVDVTRGPLQRMFGLATVSVRTASAQGSVEIEQLEAYTAAQVADDLSKRANLYDDDAT
ncbi:MAG: PH domain-containing protein [Geodermatophilaceae bacterium]|nr:PH domain-containing protein [Geodermatophilaceae bacterium]